MCRWLAGEAASLSKVADGGVEQREIVDRRCDTAVFGAKTPLIDVQCPFIQRPGAGEIAFEQP